MHRQLSILSGALWIGLALILIPAAASATETVPPSFRGAFGEEGTGEGQFEEPSGIAIDPEGNIWVADTANDRIEQFGPEGEFLAQVGEEGTGEGQFEEPSGIAIDPEGNVWVADTANDRIEQFGPEGEFLAQVGEEGTGEGQFEEPSGIAIDPEGNLQILDAGNDRIQSISPGGEYQRQLALLGIETHGLALDPDGSYWVGAPEYDCVLKLGSKKQFEVLASICEVSPAGLAISPEGGLWVADDSSGTVREYQNGSLSAEFGESGSEEDQFVKPGGLTVDSEGGIWVIDAGNDRIAHWSSSLAPVVTANAAAEIGSTSALLNGTVNPLGETLDECVFEYGASKSYGQAVSCDPNAKIISQSTEPIDVGAEISALTAGATYHFRIVATDESGTAVSADRAFTTLRPPGLASEASAVAKSRSASLSAAINPNNLDTRYFFEIGPTAGYGSKVPAAPGKDIGSGESAVDVAEAATGLEPETTYHLRIVAESEGGVSQGADQTIETDTGPPSLTAKAATAVGARRATLQGEIQANESATTYQFEYGESTEYGSKVPASAKAAGSGPEAIAVSEDIEGLEPEATYHFRLLATNESGETKGEDQTFATGDGLPVLTAKAPTAVSGRRATLHATVDPNDSATTYQFEYGTDTEYGGKAPADPGDIGSGAEPTLVGAPIHGLKPETTYDFRVVAQNASGVSYGDNVEFETGSSFEFLFGLQSPGNSTFDEPRGIAIDPEGDFWVLDAGNDLLEKLSPGGETLSQFELLGTNPSGFALDPDGSYWIGLPEEGEGCIVKFGTASQFEFLAVNCEIVAPAGMAIDQNGYLWVTEATQGSISHYNPEKEYVLGQTGEWGSGDGQLESPSGIAIDPQGNLWVADTGNDRIEEFDSEGEYLNQVGETGAGAGQLESPTSVAIDPQGDLWVADTGNDRLVEFSAEGEYLRQAGEAGSEIGQLSEPTGLAIDSEGGLWVTDTGNDLVERWGDNAPPVADTGAATGVDAGHATLHAAINPRGAATTYRFEYGPTAEYGSKAPASPGPAIGESDEEIEVEEELEGLEEGATYHYRVVAENEAGTRSGEDETLTTPMAPKAITGSATGVNATEAALNATVNPRGHATDYFFEYGPTAEYGSKAPASPESAGEGEEDIEVEEPIEGLEEGEEYHYRVVAESDTGTRYGEDRVFSSDPPLLLALEFGSIGKEDGELMGPLGLALDGEGNVYLADSENSRVQEFDSEGEYLAQFGSHGEEDGQFLETEGVAIAPGGAIYVSDPVLSRIQKFDSEGEYLSQFGSEGSGEGELSHPGGLAVDSEGDVYVADSENNRVVVFDSAGEYLREVGSSGSGDGELANPKGLALDGEGNLWVADIGNNRIEEFDEEGEYLSQLGVEGSGNGELAAPAGVAIDPAGHLYVADTDNNRIEEFDAAGEYLGQVGSQGPSPGSTDLPWGIAVDAEGDVWLTNRGSWPSRHQRVQEWVPAGGPAKAPKATTKPAADLGPESATLKAAVNPRGSSTSYYFEYGEDAEYGSKAPASPEAIGAGGQAVPVEQAIEGLQENATYHYRVVAESQAGTSTGEDETFKATEAPIAITEEAESVEGEEAVLTGSVNPNGKATEYYFEYGTSTEYGTTIAPDEAGDGSTAIEAVESIGDLEPETTYHYRIAATSSTGTDYGADKTLTTLSGEVSESEAVTLPSDFFGMMWTGSFAQTGEPHVLTAVKKSGSRMLRLAMKPGFESEYESIFRHASQRGIKVLPYLGDGVWPTDPTEQNAWRTDAKRWVARYGPGGSFWNGGGHPAVAWEIWNEPNLPTNSPFPNPSPQEIDQNSEAAAYKKIGAEKFAEFFHKVAEGLREGAGEESIHILTPGLFGFGASNCNGGECHLSPVNFLGQMHQKLAAMGHSDDYDAVSLHPYVFKVDGQSSTPHAPTGPNQVEEVTQKVRNFIGDIHNKLKAMGESDKQIWVTELGFPVENRVPDGEPGDNSVFPHVSEDVQKEEIEKTYQMIKDKRRELDIAHAFYYNIQDYRDPGNGAELLGWDYHSGLRRGTGGNRKGWKGFTAVAPKGKSNWSDPKTAHDSSVNPTAIQATPTFQIKTEGAQYLARAEWGSGPLSSSYPNATEWDVVEAGPDVEGEGEEEAVEVEGATPIAGLAPDTTYHYRIAVKNEEGVIEQEDPGHQFKTKPGVTASVRTLNGEPGWINISGHVESEAPLNNTWVNINFKKKEGGEYKFNHEESTNVELYDSNYSLSNWKIGRGDWLVNVVFEGNSEVPHSETGLEMFTIKNAYHLVAQHSGKCLEVSYGSSENGMSIHQEPCGDGHTQQAQAFTLVPSPSNPVQYELVNRNSAKCLDVAGASGSDGAAIQQYTCLGWGQTNQVFEGVPSSESDPSHDKYIAQHSGKCLDISGGSTANGALLQQWSCNGAPQQSFGFESVEADPVPTHTYITLDETLNGHPGYETFHGTVESPQAVGGQKVYVNFKRWNGSQYVYTSQAEATLNSAGAYTFPYFGVSTGDWEAIAVYNGSGNTAASSSPEGTHKFHVGDGYRFKFRNPQKCLSTSGGGTGNGTALLQWTCASPANPGDGQVYSVEPVGTPGSDYFRIRPDSDHRKCVDVTNYSQEDGAKLQLWDCFADWQNHLNQVWHSQELASPNQGWFAWISVNSNKCMDVEGASVKNGALIQQWSCHWGGNQQWEWQGIG